MCTVEICIPIVPSIVPTLTTASNYIAVKKSRVLYNQYSQSNVCSNTPSATYKSYQLRQSIVKGCLWNRRMCLQNC
jgi:hypothetical protein